MGVLPRRGYTTEPRVALRAPWETFIPIQIPGSRHCLPRVREVRLWALLCNRFAVKPPGLATSPPLVAVDAPASPATAFAYASGPALRPPPRLPAEDTQKDRSPGTWTPPQAVYPTCPPLRSSLDSLRIFFAIQSTYRFTELWLLSAVVRSRPPLEQRQTTELKPHERLLIDEIEFCG